MGKRLLLAVACAAVAGGTAAGSAFAGEVTGNGKQTPIAEYRAASICSFSGQNDDPNEPGAEGRVQSFGQIVKQFAPVGGWAGIPGIACNPTRGED